MLVAYSDIKNSFYVSLPFTMLCVTFPLWRIMEFAAYCRICSGLLQSTDANVAVLAINAGLAVLPRREVLQPRYPMYPRLFAFAPICAQKLSVLRFRARRPRELREPC